MKRYNAHMSSIITTFEINATDLDRAVKFYRAILGKEIAIQAIGGEKGGLLSSEGDSVMGVIRCAPGMPNQAIRAPMSISGLIIWTRRLQRSSDLAAALSSLKWTQVTLASLRGYWIAKATGLA
jgi:catechol-2,3-dioxygenase